MTNHTKRVKRAAAVLLAAALTLGATLMPPVARAAKFSCDPAPAAFNVMTLSKGNGAVTIDVRYGWDGVSVFPDCDGPIIRIRVTNTGTETWYAHVQRRNGTWVRVDLTPGIARNYTGGQLAQVGITTLSDLDALLLTQDPNPPAVT